MLAAVLTEWLEERETIQATPVSPIRVMHRKRVHRLLLKRESFNPTGSVKDRTAAGLVRALDAVEPLHPGTVVVESTSGNLGLALARRLMATGCRLIAVVDVKTPQPTRDLLQRAGVELRVVTEPDGNGGYLLTRLKTVRQLCRSNPSYRWTDQYRNRANPAIHEQTTGPEIIRQGGPELDAVYVAVSTGGTLAGISAAIRPLGRPIQLIAVDALRSLATPRSPAPAPSGPRSRLIPGIGASLPSSFLRPGAFDRAVAAADAEAIAVGRIFREDTGISVGGSSACVLSACLTDLDGPAPPAQPLCLAADDGEKYECTIYGDGWLQDAGVLDDVKLAVERLRCGGLTFARED
jgi:N-(2-amino-2-carboxyethyl)-L-glutamate synthase